MERYTRYKWSDIHKVNFLKKNPVFRLFYVQVFWAVQNIIYGWDFDPKSCNKFAEISFLEEIQWKKNGRKKGRNQMEESLPSLSAEMLWNCAQKLLGIGLKRVQFQFVASANFQVVLSPKWYGKSGPYLNKLRRMNVLFWYLIFLPTAVLLTLIELPLSALIYTFYPGLTVQGVRVGDLIRIPFIKFINHMASQMTFLFLLMQAASTSANRGFNRHTGSGKNHDQNYDLLNPSLTEWWICIWVMGKSFFRDVNFRT